ncbi:MAG: hypothetical protein LC802_14000 [Acidobacteria bacterium]|nr:hypothetical protein [Acidobacteriota bacterium]
MEAATSKQRFASKFTWLVIAMGWGVCLFSVYQLTQRSLARFDLTLVIVAFLTAAIGSRVAVASF